MAKGVNVEIESAPPERRARVANPGGDFNIVRELLERIVPTLTGTLVGTMEGMARAGLFDKWSDLAGGWKALIFATASAIATGAAHKLEDDRARAAMRDVAVITWAFAVAYGVEALIGQWMAEAPGDRIDPNTGKPVDGLTIGELEELSAMMEGDASEAADAVRQLIDARPDIEATADAYERAVHADEDDGEVGEILFSSAPIELGEILLSPNR